MKPREADSCNHKDEDGNQREASPLFKREASPLFKFLIESGVRLFSFLLLFELFYNSTQAKEAPQFSLESQVQLYLDYAFASQTNLKKFLLSPTISLPCKDHVRCDLIRDSMIQAFPEKSEINLLVTYDTNSTISLLTDKKTFEDAKKIEAANADGPPMIWGSEKCSAIQYMKQDTILKLIVFANPDEGVQKNGVCFVTEILKGSGGGLKSNYEQFVSIFEASNFEEFQQFKALALVALHYHWSTLLTPGMDKNEAETKLRTFLLLVPNN